MILQFGKMNYMTNCVTVIIIYNSPFDITNTLSFIKKKTKLTNTLLNNNNNNNNNNIISRKIPFPSKL